jgi:hypothetical protein
LHRKKRDASRGSPRFLTAQRTLVRNDSQLVDEEIINSGKQFARDSEGVVLLSRFSVFLSEILDSFSSFFFCLSFSSLTHLVGSWWNRLLAEE